MPPVNLLGQPIGEALRDWRPPAPPEVAEIRGRYCRLQRLDPARHAPSLYRAYRADREDRIWTYLPYGPFLGFDDFGQWLAAMAATSDPLFYAVTDLAGERALGLASYLRISPAAGSIEIGHLNFAPVLQRSAAATEALFLLLDHALGVLRYRRCEWKCDALNQASRRAALRLGFRFEGVFRQAAVYKQRNRDTAWFAIIDADWPVLARAFRTWLAPDNFDRDGAQRLSLSDLTADPPRA